MVWEASRKPVRDTIVVPDDFPSIFAGTLAHERCEALGDLRIFSERGADDEAELIRRLDRASVAINIRAHAQFTEAVFARCPMLKMISIWGTGTDNIDLDAAGRHGVTVSNTPGVLVTVTPRRPAASRSMLSVPVPQIEISFISRQAASTPSVNLA